jgi:hypothetical protein
MDATRETKRSKIKLKTGGKTRGGSCIKEDISAERRHDTMKAILGII